jgi:hypothetical protein
LKSYKSPGSDQIPTEQIQAGGETVWSVISKHMNSVWSKEELPGQWEESITVPVYKNGDKADCSKEYHCFQLHTKFYPVSSQG